MNLVEAVVEKGDDALRRARLCRSTPGGGRRGGRRDAGHPARGLRGRRHSPRPRLPRRPVTVDVLEELGADTHSCFRVGATRRSIGRERESEDASSSPTRRPCSPPASIRAAACTRGADVELAVDPARFHFFDVESARRRGRREPLVHAPASA